MYIYMYIYIHALLYIFISVCALGTLAGGVQSEVRLRPFAQPIEAAPLRLRSAAACRWGETAKPIRGCCRASVGVAAVCRTEVGSDSQ